MSFVKSYVEEGQKSATCGFNLAALMNKNPPSLMFCNVKNFIPVGNYMFKVNNRNTRTICEICSKLTIKTLERRH